ncbi:cingulin-like [Armigeres subalbatus]|uniref:cingulin-like n=1 Tax=Armigeres subalbatus TaxID=124917 RepID=UPI002ED07D71
MSSSRLEKLHQKISDYILLKNRQLRHFTSLVLDCDFLHFAEIIEDSEYFLQETSQNIESYTAESIFLGSIEHRVTSLRTARNHCLRRLNNFAGVISVCEDSVFSKIFCQRQKRTKNTFRKQFQTYRTQFEDFLLQLLDIYEIAQFQNQFSRTDFLHLIVLKNQENISHVVPQDLRKPSAIYCVSSLKLETHKLFLDLLLRHLHLLDEMESTSTESMRDRLNEEINKSRTDMVIQEAELVELRHELFPSDVSLKEQRDAVIDCLEIRELDLEHRIRSIDLLQVDIQGLELQVSKLIEERERVHEKLMEKRAELRKGIREVVRLEKLIQKIEKDISNRMVAFQQRLEDLELKRLAILEDDTLTEEERARLLAELEQEIGTIREKHDADQQLLKEKCEELKARSRSVIEDLDAFKDELVQKHLDEIRELEEKKKNATPSELELINARIAELQSEFEENMAMLDVAHTRRQYFNDEHGRYYINEFGQKVYQRESGASEYILTDEGGWEKIKDAVEIRKDEKGEFYVDNFGRKIYTKRFFEDEFGKYYIDSNGRRIYIEASIITSESESFKESEEELAETAVTTSEEEMSSHASEIHVPEEVNIQRADDFKYIQESVGLPLRKGLALVFLQQPEDPIEFLARFLEKYHYDQQREAERAQLVEDVEKMKEIMKSQIDSKDSNADVC